RGAGRHSAIDDGNRAVALLAAQKHLLWTVLRISLASLACKVASAASTGPHSGHSVSNVGLAWMQTRLACPGPWLVNLCGVCGGTVTMSPGQASSCWSPAWKVRLPSITTHVSS